jgi:hypothetical protein
MPVRASHSRVTAILRRMQDVVMRAQVPSAEVLVQASGLGVRGHSRQFVHLFVKSFGNLEQHGTSLFRLVIIRTAYE